MTDDLNLIVELFYSLSPSASRVGQPLQRAQSIYTELYGARLQTDVEVLSSNQIARLTAEVARLEDLVSRMTPDRLEEGKGAPVPATETTSDMAGVHLPKDLDSRLADLMVKLEARDKELADLKRALEAKDKNIEELKKTLTIHVDKQVIKNTTRTESHVRSLDCRKQKSRAK